MWCGSYRCRRKVASDECEHEVTLTAWVHFVALSFSAAIRLPHYGLSSFESNFCYLSMFFFLFGLIFQLADGITLPLRHEYILKNLEGSLGALEMRSVAESLAEVCVFSLCVVSYCVGCFADLLLKPVFSVVYVCSLFAGCVRLLGGGDRRSNMSVCVCVIKSDRWLAAELVRLATTAVRSSSDMCSL